MHNANISDHQHFIGPITIRNIYIKTNTVRNNSLGLMPRFNMFVHLLPFIHCRLIRNKYGIRVRLSIFSLYLVGLFCWSHLCYTEKFHYLPSDIPLKWRHYERDGVSNHRRHDSFFSHLFRRRSKKTSNFCDTCLCEGDRWIPRTKGQ